MLVWILLFRNKYSIKGRENNVSPALSYLGIFSANIFLSFYLHLLLCLSILLLIFLALSLNLKSRLFFQKKSLW